MRLLYVYIKKQDYFIDIKDINKINFKCKFRLRKNTSELAEPPTLQLISCVSFYSIRKLHLNIGHGQSNWDFDISLAIKLHNENL